MMPGARPDCFCLSPATTPSPHPRGRIMSSSDAFVIGAD